MGLFAARWLPLRVRVSRDHLESRSNPDSRPQTDNWVPFSSRSSSTQMPKAVKKAVLGVFQSEGHLEEREAESLWDKLERKGRIIEETWG